MSSTEIPPSNDHETPKSRPQLSITQILASALAAITATFAASYFGVSGTIIGAALASVVTVVGNAVYSHSIQRTRAQLRVAVPFSLVHPLNAPVAKAAAENRAEGEAPDRTRRAFRWQHAAFAAAGLFLVIAGIVTGVELAAGRPLTSIVHDRSGSGTSLFGGSHPATTHTSPKTTPSPPASSTSSTSTSPTTQPSAPQSTQGSISAPSTAPTPTPTPTPTTPLTPTGSLSVTPPSPATPSGPATP